MFLHLQLLLFCIFDWYQWKYKLFEMTLDTSLPEHSLLFNFAAAKSFDHLFSLFMCVCTATITLLFIVIIFIITSVFTVIFIFCSFCRTLFFILYCYLLSFSLLKGIIWNCSVFLLSSSLFYTFQLLFAQPVIIKA